MKYSLAVMLLLGLIGQAEASRLHIDGPPKNQNAL
jgi:hypothetical protein